LAIKASVSSLRLSEVDLHPDDQAALLGTVEDSADRLQVLIDNLLDMSRLDAGAVSVRSGPNRWRSTKTCRGRWPASRITA
jgi:two-component system sensor histidine kinase KdpD